MPGLLRAILDSFLPGLAMHRPRPLRRSIASVTGAIGYRNHTRRCQARLQPFEDKVRQRAIRTRRTIVVAEDRRQREASRPREDERRIIRVDDTHRVYSLDESGTGESVISDDEIGMKTCAEHPLHGARRVRMSEIA